MFSLAPVVFVNLSLEAAFQVIDPPVLFLQASLAVLEQLLVPKSADLAPEVVLKVTRHLDRLALDRAAELIRDLLHSNLDTDVCVPLRVERNTRPERVSFVEATSGGQRRLLDVCLVDEVVLEGTLLQR